MAQGSGLTNGVFPETTKNDRAPRPSRLTRLTFLTTHSRLLRTTLNVLLP